MAASVAIAAEDAPAPDTTVEGIIITGEKFDRSLQETTTSVGVITAKRTEQEAIQSLWEMYERTANMSETYGHSGFTIRGIASQGVSGGGDAALATIYMDGAPLPSTISFAGPTDSWDVKQVEIFRGPQSTLQGLNALAGAVVIRSQEPTSDWDMRARAIVADPDETAFAFAGGGPIIADQLAFRIAAEKRDTDGYIHNVTRDAPEDPIDTFNLRAQLLLRPTEIEGFEARLGYTRFVRDGGYPFGYASTTTPNYMEDRVSFNEIANASKVDANVVTLELSQELGAGLTLSSISSWNSVDQFNSYDGDGTARRIGYGFNQYDYETLTQELRLNYEGERISGLIGAFYYDRDQLVTSGSLANVTTPVPTISALLQSSGLPAATANQLANLYALQLPVVPVQYAARQPMDVTTHAIFGDGEWRVTDRLSLVAGFRWDHEKNRTNVDQTAVFAGTYPNPAAFGAPGTPLYLAVMGINAGVANLVAQAGSATPQAERKFDAFLPKAGLRYELTPDMTAGFVVQRGYRSGGSSINTARSQSFSYDPEYTWNYEASLRSAWLDGRLTVNANAYYIDWSDQQVAVNFGLNDFDSHTVNAGKSHLYGFEIETAHKVSEAFDWYGSVGYSKTKFDEFLTTLDGEASDLSGSEFAYAPRWTLAVGGNYRWASGFVANLNANYRDKAFVSTGFAQDNAQIKSRTLLNGRVGYETDHWGAYLYGKNLFDVGYVTYGRPTTGQAVLGDPRVLGLMLQTRW
ncbi:TonB-dependent receptor [Caulobacter segnis]|uniref:TonB-dependent receptor n=1 Tax=Caulobacter segnis TaxID=88688 RepID=UPI00241023D6|nr:TonB-dependent receptor [Caulobacter segnis]MDG2521953.1 TonB-dependent receptor [Caulobacter segnis]